MNILFALFKKDLQQAIRNRYILGFALLPIIISLGVRLYVDAPQQLYSVSTNASANSQLATILNDMQFVRAEFDLSADTLTTAVEDGTHLGILLEDDFEAKLASADTPAIQFIFDSNQRITGQVLQSLVSTILLAFEDERQVSPEIRDISEGSQAAFNLKNTLIIVILLSFFSFIAIMIIPLLMIEERDMQTLRFLLVSPATVSGVIWAKVLIGVLYCLIMELAVLAIFDELSLISSPMFVLVSLLAILIVTGTGLLTAGFLKTPILFNSWSWLPMAFLLSFGLADILPDDLTVFSQALRLLPTYSINELLTGILQNTVRWEQATLPLTYLALWILAIYVLMFRIYQLED